MPSDDIHIHTALVSVYHKDETLERIIAILADKGVRLLSTGGTRAWIQQCGHRCDAVEDVTGYPSILGGRVKTLHPGIFGGILSRRNNTQDSVECAHYGIEPIDMVIVDLYPFAETVAQGASEADIIEKIDIGGISLIRAAAKNFHDVAIVSSRDQYAYILDVFAQHGAATTSDIRRRLAREAFAVTSRYDSLIFGYFDDTCGDAPTALRTAIDGVRPLRYGENPHQRGWFFGNFESMFEQLHGKEISYNNLLDIDAATALMAEFDDTAATFAVIKHNNPCGLACRDTAIEAWRAALAGDPVSAFGGVIVTNSTVDADTAAEISKIFFEVIIAPAYSDEALDILRLKKNRIILVQKQDNSTRTTMRSALGGVLVQDRDNRTDSAEDLHTVTATIPTPAQVDDMLFAAKVVKHCRSNAIVLAHARTLCAAGVGQTSRVDSLRQAIAKAKAFGMSLDGAVMASDAFFPFGDCVQIAHEAGITAVIQPGGSIRDHESVEYCDAHGLAMSMTGIRHFRH